MQAKRLNKGYVAILAQNFNAAQIQPGLASTLTSQAMGSVVRGEASLVRYWPPGVATP